MIIKNFYKIICNDFGNDSGTMLFLLIIISYFRQYFLPYEQYLVRPIAVINYSINSFKKLLSIIQLMPGIPIIMLDETKYKNKYSSNIYGDSFTPIYVLESATSQNLKDSLDNIGTDGGIPIVCFQNFILPKMLGKFWAIDINGKKASSELIQTAKDFKKKILYKMETYGKSIITEPLRKFEINNSHNDNEAAVLYAAAHIAGYLSDNDETAFESELISKISSALEHSEDLQDTEYFTDIFISFMNQLLELKILECANIQDFHNISESNIYCDTEHLYITESEFINICELHDPSLNPIFMKNALAISEILFKDKVNGGKFTRKIQIGKERKRFHVLKKEFFNIPTKNNSQKEIEKEDPEDEFIKSIRQH